MHLQQGGDDEGKPREREPRRHFAEWGEIDVVLAEEGVEGELEYGDEEEDHEGVDDPHLIRFEVHASLRESWYLVLGF